MDMTEELKQQWIEALRSGKYKQAKGVLTNGIGYCCLGVLCDIIPHLTISEDGYTEIGKILGNGDFGIFTRMNDVEEKTFAEIADYVEQNIIAE